jgi:hypothetical protein
MNGMNGASETLIRVIGLVICVALVCFTVLQIWRPDSAAASDVDHILVGCVSALVGTYAVTYKKKKKGNGQ